MRILFLIMLLILGVFGKGLTLDTEFNSTRLSEFTEALALIETGNNSSIKGMLGHYGICGLSEQDFRESKTKVKFKGSENTLEEQRQACSDYITYVVNVRKQWGKNTTLKDILRTRMMGIIGWKKLHDAIKNPSKFGRKYKFSMLRYIVNGDIIKLTVRLDDKVADKMFKTAFIYTLDALDKYINTPIIKKYNKGVKYISAVEFREYGVSVARLRKTEIYPALRKIAIINTIRELEYNKSTREEIGYQGVIQE